MTNARLFRSFTLCGMSAAALSFSPVPARTQQTILAPSENTPLRLDPKVTAGTLPNGLRYYIRRNARPEHRAELRLVVNVGSIAEDDDQLGYAHLIEHMAFNGTAHFPRNQIVNYLQSIGMSVGADLNASTSFDETIYILRVPTDTARVVETAFRILSDWASQQTLDSAEVAAELGVVLEEWRSGKGAGERLSQQALPIIFSGSRYATRIPIGTEASIRGASASGLRRFYRDWYRPDLMSVIAVGDFDAEVIRGLVERNFGSIPQARNPRARSIAAVPANSTPLVSIATDKEATSTFVQVGFKHQREPVRTVGDYRRTLTERMYVGMLNNRLSELTRKPSAPFTFASVSYGGFIGREVAAFTIAATVPDGGMERGLEGVLTEIRRVDEHGFLQSELDRQRTNILRGYERSYTERENETHGAYVGAYISAFLNGTIPTGIEDTYPLVQQLLPTITLAEVNALGRKWITQQNRVVMAQAPDKEAVRVPTANELLAVFGRAAATPVTPYTEELAAEPLMRVPPTPGRVISERTLADVGVSEWRLSNGARVLVKPTDFKADEILFRGSSDGGVSLASDAEWRNASYASLIVGQSGAGRFNAVDLGKKLAGKVAGASAGISTYSDDVSGTTTPRDLEAMLQVLHLRLTQPRVDTAAWIASKQRMLVALANRGASPQQVYSDTIAATLSQYNFRSMPISAAELEAIDLGRAFAFYRDRFADMGDFTFAFVGNVQLDTLKPLVERYLASLPSQGRNETWKDIALPFPPGITNKVVRKGTDVAAVTQIVFSGAMTHTPDSAFALSALMSLFQIKLVEALREQMGATYSPFSGGSSSRIPSGRYTITVGYQSAPENVDTLTASVFALIEALKRAPPSAADVDKVREQFLRQRETASKTNAYWIGAIASRDEPIDNLGANLAAAEARIRDLTGEQIQRAAQRFFNVQEYARFVLLPEK
jgi:zinc protease